MHYTEGYQGQNVISMFVRCFYEWKFFRGTSSRPAYHKFEPYCHFRPIVKGLMQIKTVEAQSLVVGGVPFQVSFSLLDRGAKFRDSSPVAFVLFCVVTLINIYPSKHRVNTLNNNMCGKH
ncbi:hypothetical protein TNCV_2544491 [Trichonephila clavipes]|nr:hypothetical protein TNCV_2544491 [Trichonephila clavipes]